MEDLKEEDSSLLDYLIKLFPNIDVSGLLPWPLLSEENCYNTIHKFLWDYFNLTSLKHQVTLDDGISSDASKNEAFWISKLFPKLSFDYIHEQLDILLNIPNRAEILVQMLVHTEMFTQKKQTSKRPADGNVAHEFQNKVPKREVALQEVASTSLQNVVNEPKIEGSSQETASTDSQKTIVNEGSFYPIHEFPSTSAQTSSWDEIEPMTLYNINDNGDSIPDFSGCKKNSYTNLQDGGAIQVLTPDPAALPVATSSTDLNLPSSSGSVDGDRKNTENGGNWSSTPDNFCLPGPSTSHDPSLDASSTVNHYEPIPSTSSYQPVIEISDDQKDDNNFNLIEYLFEMTCIEKNIIRYYCQRHQLCITQRPTDVEFGMIVDQLLQYKLPLDEAESSDSDEGFDDPIPYNPLKKPHDANNRFDSYNSVNSLNVPKVDISDEVLESTASSTEEHLLKSQSSDISSESLITTTSVSLESQMSQKRKIQSTIVRTTGKGIHEFRVLTSDLDMGREMTSRPVPSKVPQHKSTGTIPKTVSQPPTVESIVIDNTNPAAPRIRKTSSRTIKKTETGVVAESKCNNAEVAQSPMQADAELVKTLLQIFPDACPIYIKGLCVGKVNSPLVLDDLLTVILETENGYPKRPPPEPEPEVCPDEQFAILKEVLPDADPDYLRLLCNQYEGKSDLLKTAFHEAVESGNYPTMKDYQRRQQISAQQKQYTTEFNIENFVKTIPDPMAFFSDPARVVKLDSSSTNYAMVTLRNIYDKLPVRLIQSCFNKSKKFLATALELDSLADRNTLKTRRRQLAVPATIDNIPLLQEIAYFINKPAIEYYMKNQKKLEEAEREDARKKGLLKVCGCCYDEDILPKETYTCNNGCVFCKNCIIKSTEVLFGEGKLEFPCLAACTAEFSLQTLQAAVSPKLFSKLAQKKALAEVKAAGIEELEMCPFCDFATIPAEGDKIFSCLNSECMKQSCRACKEPSHIPLRCDEVEKDDDVKARVFIENKMTEALLRKCWKCGVKFFKEEGCNKMTCSCGAKMCYICNQPVTDYKHFNGQGGDRFDLCPLYSDNNKVNKENVLRGAAEAKAEIGNKELKIDPTADINQHYNKNRPSTSGNVNQLLMPLENDINVLLRRFAQQPIPGRRRVNIRAPVNGPNAQQVERLNAIRNQYHQNRVEMNMALARLAAIPGAMEEPDVNHPQNEAAMNLAAWHRRRR